MNAAFLSFSLWFETARPWINIDYAVALMLLTFGWRWTGGVATLAFLLIDIFTLVTQIFPFPRLSDLLYLLSFSFLASELHLSILIGVVVLVVLKFISFLRLSIWAEKKSALVVLNFLLVVQIYFIYVVDDRYPENNYRQASSLPVSSQTINFMEMRSDIFLSFFNSDDATLKSRSAGATAPWFSALGQDQLSPRLLLVVSESWGVPVNPDIQEALLSPLNAVPRTRLEFGTIIASGTTLDGELRELCMLQSNSYDLADLKQGFEPCLANRLKARGYSAVAMHGATGMMYDRRHWYPRAGFQKAIFFEDNIWPRRCFSFPGACDLDMLAEIEVFFADPGSKFFYWLTLNSHAPYDRRDIMKENFDCKAFAIPTNSETCRNLLLQAQLFSGLAYLLSMDSMANVDIIIVGDHAPVLMNVTERHEHFAEGVLPWLRLTTKPFATNAE